MYNKPSCPVLLLFLRALCTDLYTGYSNLHCHQQCMGGSLPVIPTSLCCCFLLYLSLWYFNWSEMQSQCSFVCIPWWLKMLNIFLYLVNILPLLKMSMQFICQCVHLVICSLGVKATPCWMECWHLFFHPALESLWSSPCSAEALGSDAMPSNSCCHFLSYTPIQKVSVYTFFQQFLRSSFSFPHVDF